MADIAPPPLEGLQLLADPQRWHLLTLLAQGDRRVGELVTITGKAQNLVSYHLGLLRAAGLVSTRRSSADGRDAYYRLHLDRVGAVLEAAGSALHPALGGEPDSPVPARRRPPRVLFLCTGNSARSQIAEALAVHRAGGELVARSAGSHPKPLHPEAVRVLAERGIDIAGRSTTHLDRYARQRFDRVVTLCDKVREVCPELPGSPVTAHWSIPDPSADPAGPAAFDLTADEIEARVDLLLADLDLRPERSPHVDR